MVARRTPEIGVRMALGARHGAVLRMVVGRILRITVSGREIVERVHAMHREHCPVYRSICRAIDVTTSYELVSGS